MKIVWLAQWFRGLAHIYAAEFARAGHEVLVVCGDGHPEPGPPLVDEVVLRARLRTASLPGDVVRAAARIAEFRPDVAVVDDTWDPRFIGLSRLVSNRWLAVHDGKPHDPTHIGATWQLRATSFNRRHAHQILVFSDAVGEQVSREASASTARVVLTSDLQQDCAPPVTDAEPRRDFVVAGRLRPYKNFDVIAQAWRRHVEGPHFRGDKLVVLGSGPEAHSAHGLPHVEVREGFYSYDDVAGGLLSGFKANLCVYTQASQSGVQVLSMQLGVAPIVSTAGGLPEYQASGLPVLDPNDVSALAASLDELADPSTALSAGQTAARWYRDRLTASRAAESLLTILREGV